jgi:beta-lactamase class A
MRSLKQAAFLAGFAFLLLAGGPEVARAEETLQSALRAGFEADLARAAEGVDGVVGYAVKDLESGETFLRFPDTVFPQASSIKIAVLLELLRQAQEETLALESRHTVRADDTTAAAGDTEPVLHMLGDGTATLSLRDLAVLMIVLSDNSATNILIDRVGMENVNRTLGSLGLEKTRLRRRMLDLEAARRGNENTSTPREMMALLEAVRTGRVLDAAHRKEFWRILSLPKDGPHSVFRRAIPSEVPLANKTGWLEGVRCESGVVELPGRPFILSVMTAYLARDEDGDAVIEEIARISYNYFSRLAASSEDGRRLPME